VGRLKKVLGIDEAGRGPVVGPMIICGYLIDEKKIPKLWEWGVKDSKLLTKKKREELSPLLEGIAEDFIIVKIDAHEIDKLRTKANLNMIEIEKMQTIINLLNPDKVIIDACESNTQKFKEKILSGINKKTEIICENFADRKYPVVGAASILAKVYRDNEILELRKLGFSGSGYPSDPKTIAFLKKWLKKNKNYPNFVRKSWFTAQYLKEQEEQSKLNDFALDK